LEVNQTGSHTNAVGRMVRKPALPTDHETPRLDEKNGQKAFKPRTRQGKLGIRRTKTNKASKPRKRCPQIFFLSETQADRGADREVSIHRQSLSVNPSIRN